MDRFIPNRVIKSHVNTLNEILQNDSNTESNRESRDEARERKHLLL